MEAGHQRLEAHKRALLQPLVRDRDWPRRRAACAPPQVVSHACRQLHGALRSTKLEQARVCRRAAGRAQLKVHRAVARRVLVHEVRAHRRGQAHLVTSTPDPSARNGRLVEWYRLQRRAEVHTVVVLGQLFLPLLRQASSLQRLEPPLRDFCLALLLAPPLPLRQQPLLLEPPPLRLHALRLVGAQVGLARAQLAGAQHGGQVAAARARQPTLPTTGKARPSHGGRLRDSSSWQ
mmetsp:Transcript_8481/g.25679  ORF Transcript_8481/g.25679 Transcript_8481/m.25679 type:complete len:234 (-) Transcript_8481:192-893(-)